MEVLESLNLDGVESLKINEEILLLQVHESWAVGTEALETSVEGVLNIVVVALDIATRHGVGGVTLDIVIFLVRLIMDLSVFDIVDLSVDGVDVGC